MIRCWILGDNQYLKFTELTKLAEQPMDNAEQEIKANMQAFADAWNIYDAKQLASVFVEDADFVNIGGHWLKGRTEIEQGHTNAFASNLRNTKISFPETQIKFLKPDLAIYHTTWELTLPNNLPPKHGVLTGVTAYQDSKWQIVAVHNTETLPIPGYVADQK